MSHTSLSSGKVPQTSMYFPSDYGYKLADLGKGDDLLVAKAVVNRPISFVQKLHHMFSVQDLRPPLPGILTQIDTVDVGAYGEVYRGTYSSAKGSKLQVAIKRIRQFPPADEDRIIKRVQQELSIMTTLKHSHIVPFLGYQVVNGAAALVSPWYENGNLMDYLRKRPNANDSLKLRLLCDAARGLDYLHSLTPPIVHGDLKPENILISDEATSHLCDFGLARVVDTVWAGGGLSRSGLGVGSVAYQSPEILLGTSQITTMSDIWAFGGLTLAAMTGKAPFFRKRTAAAIILAICRDETAVPADHPELPADDPLWDFCMSCWDPEPHNRPSVVQIIGELEAERQQRSPPH